ncbi:hypothetical protein DFR70_104474 [Nocardia tenerifensis]|uniref:Uncharacterized protein n=1 Tax=Nocardia tenerifensis TaxID=228006 RepID=A0A318K3G5_9NOCA|nr:hypothetical protein [Nocardia tenerifensis]PXX65410.1 hypothetical protein DFR70_104474 [Nocardia tenerifensis]
MTKPARTRRADPALDIFRRHIGARVTFIGFAAERGAVEHGVVVDVDHRMVYVDYGYPNPVCTELGNAIATHPSNLRLETTAAAVDHCAHCGSAVRPGPVFLAPR